jgi:hypothetical protein
MDSLSPAAQAFWGAAIAHVLTFIGAAFVTHGYVSQQGASAYEQELVGVILAGGVQVWRNRVTYWQQIRAVVGQAMPKGTTHAEVVAKVAELKEANALPSVFTPSTVATTLVKPA